jgi:hypothetical protein
VAHCILLLTYLCTSAKSIYHDKPVLALAAGQTIAQIADGYTTRVNILHGEQEGNPINRFFIGRYPTWKTMAPWGATQIIGTAWVSDRMHHSSHRWIRDTYWIPQAVSISLSLDATRHNYHIIRSR